MADRLNLPLNAVWLLGILDSPPSGAYTSDRTKQRAPMPTAKQQVLDAVKKLPDKATWDDIMYEIYVRKKIDAGIHAADEGRVVPHEAVKKRFIKK